MPGIGEVMDGMMQQAPHASRQSKNSDSKRSFLKVLDKNTDLLSDFIFL
jgi:hypothetical protein